MRSTSLLFAALLPLAAFAAERKPAPAPEAKTAAVALKPERCEAPTGSRIRPPKGSDCKAPRPGMRSYSEEDLERTGQPEVADALKRIDPAFGF